MCRRPLMRGPGLSAVEIAGRFNRYFGPEYRIRLLGGAEEPLYLPARGGQPAIIRYTRDYARSALHELAHWCVAGARRRELADYGYWYQPPPRTLEQQQAFMIAEIQAQALESLFAAAAGVPFRVSCDELDLDPGFEAEFACRVAECAARWAANLPPRARALQLQLELGRWLGEG